MYERVSLLACKTCGAVTFRIQGSRVLLIGVQHATGRRMAVGLVDINGLLLVLKG